MAWGKIFSIVKESSECCICSKLRAFNQCASINTDYGEFIVCNDCSLKMHSNTNYLIDPHNYQINEINARIAKLYIESIFNE
jgi:hypothetical protein